MRRAELTRTAIRAAVGLACLWGSAVRPALAVSGFVVNGTTGRPQSGVMLTLSSFRGGMTPLEEVQSGNDGSFEFAKELPAVGSGQPFQGAIRAEHEGIGYTEILRGGAAHVGLRITVYAVQDTSLPAPRNRVVIVEPGNQEMVVRESYQFVNEAEPPVTYSSAEGTLQFYLPPEAAGNVDVSGTGPAGMPLRSTALPSGVTDLYKVDFPLKPGENRIDLQYAIAYTDGAELVVRSAYEGLQARVAAPAGVAIEGVGITELGQEPTTQASIWVMPPDPAVTLRVTGTGQLARSGSGSGSGSSDIRVAPAPVAEELAWIICLTVGILGVGFFHLWSASGPAPPRGPGRGSA